MLENRALLFLAVDLYTGTVLEIKFCMLPPAKRWVCEQNVVKHRDVTHQRGHAGKPKGSLHSCTARFPHINTIGVFL